jgi:phage protein D
MTTPTTLVAVRPDGGYAPDFAVRVSGQLLDEGTHNDIRDLRVVLDSSNMSSFNLTINNWDDSKLRFKYSELDNERFDTGNTVEISLGYGGQLIPVAAGTITTMQPYFPDAASPNIAISGTDKLQELKDRKPPPDEPVIYRDKADWQIAQIIAGRHKLLFKSDQQGPVWPEVIQRRHQDDATFLMERATRNDFECYIRVDPKTGVSTLHFQSPTDGRQAASGDQGTRVCVLAYGPGLAGDADRQQALLGRAQGPAGQVQALIPNLLSFTPTLTLHKQVSSVTVRGWDPRTKQSIAYEATASDLPSGQGKSGPGAAAAGLAGRQEAVIDAPVANQEEARRLAIALLRERAYTFISGTGRIAGLPELRPGDNVEIHGIGRRFSGSYYVLTVEHTLSTAGFFTQFGCRRIYDGTR